MAPTNLAKSAHAWRSPGVVLGSARTPRTRHHHASDATGGSPGNSRCGRPGAMARCMASAPGRRSRSTCLPGRTRTSARGHRLAYSSEFGAIVFCGRCARSDDGAGDEDDHRPVAARGQP